MISPPPTASQQDWPLYAAERVSQNGARNHGAAGGPRLFRRARRAPGIVVQASRLRVQPTRPHHNGHTGFVRTVAYSVTHRAAGHMWSGPTALQTSRIVSLRQESDPQVVSRKASRRAGTLSGGLPRASCLAPWRLCPGRDSGARVSRICVRSCRSGLVTARRPRYARLASEAHAREPLRALYVGSRLFR